MKLKKYRGRNVPDLLRRIRRELGKEALILQTRPVIEGGLLGFFGKSAVEVVVAFPDGESTIQTDEADRRTLDLVAPREAPSASNPVRREEKLASAVRPSSAIEKTSDVKRPFPQGREGCLAGEKNPRGKEAPFLPLRISPGIGKRKAEVPRRAVFLGPAGAGKTSCLGRLAWHLSSTEKTLVLSLEEEGRLSGVSRWKDFWETLGVDYRPCLDPAELTPSRWCGYGAVLVDTPPLAGRETPFWLDGLLERLEGFERFLVVDGYMEESECRELLRRCGAIKPCSLIVSKLDCLFRPQRWDSILEKFPFERVYYTRDPSITSPLLPWEETGARSMAEVETRKKLRG